MKVTYVLALNSKAAELPLVGGKGASLAMLSRAGLPVPDGFHITTGAYDHFVKENNLRGLILDELRGIEVTQQGQIEKASSAIQAGFMRANIPDAISDAVLLAYQGLSGQNPAVAVRSSATAEDLPEASFAGQQESYLNITGKDPLMKAVRRCWASLWTARAIGYRMRQNIHPDQVSLAVVVQQLVHAESAGILFTANPISGERNHVMLSASWGLGEAVVGGLVTPDTLVVDKKTKRMLSRCTSDKQVMTVTTGGSTVNEPVPANLKQKPVLNDNAAARLTGLGVQIEQYFGMPMDIEWAFAAEDFHILQARPITALPADPNHKG